jgi:signal transduction histidine kinase/CheY-like chemotaxis protein
MNSARQSAIRLLQWMMVASVALPVVLFAFASWLNYRAYFRIADDRIERSLDVVQEQGLHSLQASELAISAVEEVLSGLSDEAILAEESKLHDRLKEVVGEVSQVQSVLVVGADGHPLLSSSIFPVPKIIDDSDRDYFRTLRSGNIGTYVGEALLTRTGQEPVFTVSRRRPAAAGTFTGVIVVALRIARFHAFYREIGHTAGAYFALARNDGKFLVRYPAPARTGVQLDGRSALRQSIVTAPVQGIYDVTSQLDDIARRIGYRKIGNWPVYAMAGVEISAIRAEWWSFMSSHLIYGLPATALIFGVLSLALQRTRRLYAEADRRELAEDALRQSQKMESIGQLTGGVAHDFNNLLTVVIGNLELAERGLGKWKDDGEARLRRLLQNAMQGAQRAASLTQRLLAFARRQPLKPETLNTNELVSGMSDLLHRALGETVRTEVVVAAGLWPVEADRVQLESSILNLALNARDAMPDGGKLTIETCNAFLDEAYCSQHADLTPGQYVMIAVSDNGAGMSKEVMERAFEPFFTTKEAGQGTGLGLSQVYGFIKQSGGHVSLYSEPGQGTSVKIYLPRHVTGAETQPVTEAPATHSHSDEMVLVVEDDAEVRAYILEALQALNYTVIEASDATGAATLMEQHGEAVDLLLTDVVLPGLNGRQLALQLQRRFHHLRVLFMTGYSRNAIVHQGKLDADVELIQKPFTQAALGAKIRSVLDQPRRPQSLRALS